MKIQHIQKIIKVGSSGAVTVPAITVSVRDVVAIADWLEQHTKQGKA